MDFWTRLLGGSGVSQSKSTSNDPQQRIARFKRTHNQVLRAWHTTQSVDLDAAAVNAIRTGLRRLSTTIYDESRGPAPHACAAYAATSHIYNAVSRIVTKTRDEGITREALAFFSTLVDTEGDDFLGNATFAKAFAMLVESIARPGRIFAGTEMLVEAVELIFGIMAKIRLQPELLSAWFSASSKPEMSGEVNSQMQTFVGVTKKEDFPLCYQLIAYVHHEGAIGDFARTGLLYIFECASMSEELEHWIIESDLATLMASGIGALYSQLSRKLSIHRSAENLPAVLALSDYALQESNLEAETYLSPTCQEHLKTFVSFLMFWQDVLKHCRSVDLTQTLTDHFRVIFLQQLLYPTILESSDVDGGSSVAVLTYLRHMLDSAEHSNLVHALLSYLLALPEDYRLGSAAREKGREPLHASPATYGEEEPATPAIFSMADLILASIESSDGQTVAAALKLSNLLLGQHDSYALSNLLRVDPVKREGPLRKIGALHAEIDAYIDLARILGGDNGIDEAFADYLEDAQDLLEARCTDKLSNSGGTSALGQECKTVQTIGNAGRHVEFHTLSISDPFLRAVLKLLKNLFTNDVETNIYLTGVIVNMASCYFLCTDGWLSVDPSNYHYSDVCSADEEPSDHRSESLDALDRIERDRIIELAAARRRPTWSAAHDPSILAALKDLVSQLETPKSTIPEFDALVAQRKEIFRTTSQLNEAVGSISPQLAPRSARQSLDESDSTQRPSKDAVPPRLRVSQRSSSRASSTRGRSPQKRGELSERSAVSSPAASATRKSGDRDSASPLRVLLSQGPPETFEPVETMAANAELLQRKIRFSTKSAAPSVASSSELAKPSESQGDHLEEWAAGADKSPREDVKEVSLNHLLTNVVILQEFMLELAALIQVRARLLEEVSFV